MHGGMDMGMAGGCIGPGGGCAGKAAGLWTSSHRPVHDLNVETIHLSDLHIRRDASLCP